MIRMPSKRRRVTQLSKSHAPHRGTGARPHMRNACSDRLDRFRRQDYVGRPRHHRLPQPNHEADPGEGETDQAGEAATDGRQTRSLPFDLDGPALVVSVMCGRGPAR
jgi:hypothetical protein